VLIRANSCRLNESGSRNVDTQPTVLVGFDINPTVTEDPCVESPAVRFCEANHPPPERSPSDLSTYLFPAVTPTCFDLLCGLLFAVATEFFRPRLPPLPSVIHNLTCECSLYPKDL